MYKQLVNNILICIGIVSLVSCRGDAQEIITNMKGGISAPGISDTGPGLNPDTDTGGTDPGETVPEPEPEPVLDPNLYYTIPAAWGSGGSNYPNLADIALRFDVLYLIVPPFTIEFSEDVTGKVGVCTQHSTFRYYEVDLDETFFDYSYEGETLTILQRTAAVMYELTYCVLNQGTAAFDSTTYSDGCNDSIMSESLDTDACLSLHWDDLIRRHKREYGTGGTLRQ